MRAQLLALILIFALAPSLAQAQSIPPKTIKIPTGSTAIDGELYSPLGLKPAGLVVIAYGVDGMQNPWGPMIRGYAEELSKLGFFALIPDYLQKTRTTPGPATLAAIQTKKEEWATALLDTVAHARTPRSLSNNGLDRIGLLGFSLGGHLVLRIRAEAKPRALVQYFAPKLDLVRIAPGAEPVPKAQIHHGTKDEFQFTQFSNAGAIEKILKDEGTVVKLFPYEGAGHGFVGDDAANKNARELSQTETLKFFHTNL